MKKTESGGGLPKVRSEAEREFLEQVQLLSLPQPAVQLRFAPKRRWRADFAWPKARLIVEIEGGLWSRKGAKRCKVCGGTPTGRHTSGKGFEGDLEKYNAATLLGWAILRFTPRMVRTGEATKTVEEFLKRRGGE